MKHQGQEGHENQRKGQWVSTFGNGAMALGEVMATDRNSAVKDKSSASRMESKGSTDAGLKQLVKCGGAKGSCKEKWITSHKG